MKRSLLWPLLTALLALILAVFGAAGAARAQQARHTLSEMYLSALDDAAEELESLALSLEKLLVSADVTQEAVLLSRISQSGENILCALSRLPVDHDALTGTLSFANRLSDHATMLLARTVAEGPLSADDRTQLDSELAACRRLSGELTLARQTLTAGAFALTLADSPITYPEPVYTGRYGQAHRDPVGLTGRTIGEAEAITAAERFLQLSVPGRVTCGGIRSGPMAAFLLTAQLDDLTVDLAVTEQGGHLLWMTPGAARFDAVLSEEECVSRCTARMPALGFDALTPVWQEVSGGMLSVTLAPVQEGAVLYADLVRAQVRMDTGEVIGLDASAYLSCHAPRTLSAPALSRSEAAALLSPEVQVLASQRCLLPTYDAEVLCYEFRVRRDDVTYLIFLDAATGREVLIRRIVFTPGGSFPA